MSLDKQQDMQAVLESMGESMALSLLRNREEIYLVFYFWSTYQKYAEIS